MSDMVFGVRFTGDSRQLVGESKSVQTALDGVSVSAQRGQFHAQQMGAAHGSVAEQMSRSRAEMDRLNRSSEALANSQSLVKSGLAGLSIALLGRQVLDAATAMDRFNSSIAVATGSASNAATEYEHVRQLSQKLGLEITGTAQAYASFSAAARGSALEGEKARTVFDSVAGVAAKMGLNGEQSSGVFLALSQMMSKGVVSAEEFRQQLGERLPIATEAGARAMKVTTAEFINLLNSGKLLSEDFLPKFASALNEMGGGNGPVVSLQASLNRLSNNWTDIKLKLGDSAPLNGAISGLASLTEHTNMLSTGLAGVVAAGSAYGALRIAEMARSAAVGMLEKSAAAAADRAATLAAAEAEVVRTAAVVAGTRANAAMGVGYAAHTAAVAEHTVALAAQTAAQTASSASAGVVRGALALLGGPIGVITLALGVGAAAWALWGNRARDAAAEAGKAVAAAEARAAKLGLNPKQTLAEDLDKARAERDRLRNLGASTADIRAADNNAWALAAKLDEIAVREKNLAAAQASASIAASKWGESFLTPIEKKRKAIADLDALYQAETQRYVGNQEQQLRLAREYQARRSEIERGNSRSGGADSELSRYQKLMQASNDRIAALSAEATGADKLSQAEKDLVVFEAQMAAGKTGLTGKHNEAAHAKLQEVAATEQASQAALAEQKAREDLIKRMDSENKSLTEKIAAVELETASIGKTKTEIDLLQAARYDHETQILRETLATKESANACTADTEVLREAINLREKYKQSQTDQSAAHARQAQIDQEKKANQEMWQSVDRTAHDTFVSIANGGKDTATRLKESFKNGFFDWLYQMTMQKWIINVSASASGSGAYSVPGSVMGGGASGNFGMPGLGGGSLLGSGISMLGNAFGSAGMSAFGTGMGLASAEAAAASSAYASAGMASTGSALSAGSMVSTAMPYIAAAAAVISLLGGSLGGGGGNNYHQGQTSASFDASGKMSSVSSTTFRSAQSDSIVTGMEKQYLALIDSIGGTAKASQFSYQQAYADSVGTMFSLSGGAGGKSASAFTQHSDAAVSLAASRAIFAAVQGSDLPAYLKKAFDGLTPASATLEQINSAYAFAQGLKAIHDQLNETRTPLEIARASMAGLGKQLKTTAETYQADYLAAVNAGIDQATLAKWQGFGVLIKQVTDLEAQRVQAEQQASQAARDHIKALQDQSIADFRAAQSSTDALRAFATSVRDLQRTLWLGAQSPLSGAGSVMFTRAQFDSVNAAAAAGNTTAQGNLASAATQYLDAFKSQARSSLEYAREFANVQQALSDTAMVTDQAVTVADKQLEELKKVNTWLSAIDGKNATQNQSLSYLLQASIASSEAARVAAVAQAMVDATNGIKAAVGTYGGTYDAKKLTTTQDAATGMANLSYVDGYRTVSASVSRTASVTAPTTTIDQVAKSQADAAAAASAARVKAKADALAALNSAKTQAYVEPQYIGVYYTSLVRQMPWLDVFHQLPAIDASIANSNKRISDAQAYYNSLPAYAAGTNEVLRDGMAIIHAGEEIKSKPFVDSERSERAENNRLIARLVEEVAQLRRDNKAQLEAVASNTKDSANMARRWNNDGLPATRAA